MNAATAIYVEAPLYEGRPSSNRASRLASIIATQQEVLTAELSLKTVMSVVCAKSRELLHAESAGIAMFEDGALVYVAMSGPAMRGLGTRVAVDTSLTGLAFTTRQTLHSPDTERDVRVDLAACRTSQTRSMIAVPLRSGHKSLGVLSASSTRPHAFEPEDIEILELFAGVIGAAIARAAEFEAKRTLMEEREKAARTAEQQTAMLRLLFESAPQLIGVLQLEGADMRVVEINPAGAAFMGRERAEIVGRLSSELGSSAEWVKRLNDARLSREPVRFNYTRGAGEAARVMAATVSALPFREGDAFPRFAYVCEDVTDKSRFEDQLALNERMACVGRLAGGVAHEMNNPLAYVNSNVAFVTEELKDPSFGADADRVADARDALADALGGVDRVVRIVRDLQTFVRAGDEVDGIVDVSDVLDRCVALIHNEIKHKAKLELRLSNAPIIRGNEGQLAHAAIQLLQNAAQAMPAGAHGTKRITLRTGATASGGAFFEVEDEGVGMTPDVAKRIFEPFFTTRAIGAGMGLGLTVCRNIISAHGGSISVRTAPGAGTTMRVEFPRVA